MRYTRSSASTRSNLPRNPTSLNTSSRRSRACVTSAITTSWNYLVHSRVPMAISRWGMDFYSDGVLRQGQHLLIPVLEGTRRGLVPRGGLHHQKCIGGVIGHPRPQTHSQRHKGWEHSLVIGFFKNRALWIYNKDMWFRFLQIRWLKCEYILWNDLIHGSIDL